MALPTPYMATASRPPFGTDTCAVLVKLGIGHTFYTVTICLA
jgi:hypothetical protein